METNKQLVSYLKVLEKCVQDADSEKFSVILLELQNWIDSHEGTDKKELLELVLPEIKKITRLMETKREFYKEMLVQNSATHETNKNYSKY